MQDIIVKLLQESSGRIFTEEDVRLIQVTLSSCYELPESIAKIRPSYIAFKNCIGWGGTVENGLASALLTLNSAHGPFHATYNLIENILNKNIDNVADYVTLILKDGHRIPGFGNPVIKEEDTRLTNIETELCKQTKQYFEIKHQIEESLESNKNIKIAANLVFHVASVAYHLGLPREHSSILAIIGFELSYLNRIRLWQ